MSRKPALDDAEKGKAYEVYKTGANDNVIALKLGCSVDQVKRWRAATIFDVASELVSELSMKDLTILIALLRTYIAEVDDD